MRIVRETEVCACAATDRLSGIVVSNEYDHLSRRIRKVSSDGNHVYFYDGWNLVLELVHRPDNTTDRIEYFWGPDISGTLQGAGGIGGLLYLKYNGAIYIPFYDAYGNILGYWDASGDVVATYTYDAFGKTISSAGPLADAFGFRYSTKYFDPETGLYYYGYRYYSPELRRWMTRDPIEEHGGVNLYTICGNRVVSLFDILGKSSSTVVVEGLGIGWAGATISLKGRTAVQLNGELFYLTTTHQQGMYIPRGGSTSSLYLFKGDNVKKCLRLDYHEIPVRSANPGVWHMNVDGKSGIAKVSHSRSLNHYTSDLIKGTGKTVTVFKYGGKICFVAGIGMSAVDIYKADNRVREVAKQTSGLVGAFIGGKIGASWGMRGGVATALALGQSGPQVLTPEELVSVPIFGVVGGMVGGVVGGLVGGFSGIKTTETAYDWIFTPLEKEEWEVGCESK